MNDESKIPEYMSAMYLHAHVAQDRIAGEKALRRLLPIALRDTGQSNRVARLLLGCYNGRRFPFDLNSLRSLDYEIMSDCLAVLRMDSNALQEVHCYFERGSAIFENLAKRFEPADEVHQ
ncbi:MAG: hypothetical protein MUE63_00030 [Xanthomonadales bacterium]|jgi:hypothetical protein|nr:hypothetical protein [Xanthomonadales bacterium]